MTSGRVDAEVLTSGFGRRLLGNPHAARLKFARPSRSLIDRRSVEARLENRVEVSGGEVGTAKVCVGKAARGDVSAPEQRIPQIRTGQVRRGEPRSSEVCASCFHPRQVCGGEVHVPDAGSVQLCSREVRVSQTCTVKVRFAEVSAPEVGVLEGRTSGVSATEVLVAKAGVTDALPRQVAPGRSRGTVCSVSGLG